MNRKNIETVSLLSVAPILISLGTERLDSMPVVGLVLVIIGVGVLILREYRKTK